MTDIMEVCPHCMSEVMLENAKLKTRQKCPECGMLILPCSLCENPHCTECYKKQEWEHYLKYLINWVKHHSESECHGMSPACFDEFCDNDDDEYYDSVSMSDLICDLKGEPR